MVESSKQCAPDTSDGHRLEIQRRANRDAIRELGAEPYGGRLEGLISVADARSRYDERADLAHKENGKEDGFVDARPVVKVAGRVMLHRDNGKLVWMQLRDATSMPDIEGAGDLQIAVSKRDCREPGFEITKIADLGDVLVAEGPLTRTRTGEITLWASSVVMASKSLSPPPEKWAGLQDPEARRRRRYVDLYANPQTMRTALERSKIITRIRSFLEERSFVEVETPMLQPLPGGAAARPFATHLNALDIDMYLRIAPELYLKRLLVGGMPRVYEINRNFRNEGIDREHNPEFTMLELYQAFGDYNAMMELTESMLRMLAHCEAVDSTGQDASLKKIDPADVRLPFGDLTIDFGSPFARIAYGDLFEKALGFAMSDTARVMREASSRGIACEGMAEALVVHALFESVAEDALDPARPTFVYDYPASVCPLTRSRRDDDSIAERFELFIAGMELANAYTELNDPDAQEAKFREQLAGLDDEDAAFRTFDADFIDALKVGMPPAGGLGVGIDRLVMLLTNERSIRDVILFPFLRPSD